MVFDNLITTHSSITYTASSVERIYFEQALKLLPTHVLSKIISEGWKVVIYDDVNELITIDSQLTTATTGVTEYEMRRVFVKGVVDGRNEISFKSTLLHELTHTFDCIIDGSYCNWKSEKYYNSELENLITQEGSNFSEYARSDVKEYLSTVVSRYLLNLTDFSTVPLTKAFIEKYFFMCEDSLEQRLQNLENNAVTYIELDETYNRLKYSKLNKENDKYIIQLPEASSGSGSSSSGDNKIIYDNNVTFSTSVSYFPLNKTVISYITATLDDSTTGIWELRTILGNNSSVAAQYRRFIVNSRDSSLTDFTSVPHEQRRYFDYNVTRSWTDWEDVVSDIDSRLTSLENNQGSTGGSSGGSINIDDNTISTTSTWSSAKIEDFVHTNDGVIWSDVQGENLFVEFTKEGYLREVEIWGNTIQNDNNTQHLGEPVDGNYKIEIVTTNSNLFNPSQEITDNSYIDDNGVIKTLNGYAVSMEYIKVKPSTSYICENSNYVAYYDENKTFIKREASYGYQQFTTSADCYYVRFQIEWSRLENNNLDLHRVAEGLRTERFAIPSYKSHKSTLFLPCQLCKVDDTSDRLYWDDEKGKYIVEKKTNNSEIIETNITEKILQPTYIDKTLFFVTGGIDGIIKAKAPLDGGQALQTLSEEVITLSLENEEIKEVNNVQDELIDTTMLATDELYTMIEPILETVPQTMSIERSVSKMVDMYVCMVQRGLKTIDQVPLRYREEVRRILEELEK